MPVVKDPTLWDFIPKTMKIKCEFDKYESFTGGHPLIPRLSKDEDQMISILLDTMFHQESDQFLYLFDVIKEIEDILLSIKIVERKPLLLKLIQLGSKCSIYKDYNLIIDYLIKYVKVIIPSQIKTKRTLGNILRANSKIIQSFLNHTFEYRPPEDVEYGKEEMYSYLPGAHTIDNLNTTFDAIQETSNNVEQALKETTKVLKDLAPKVNDAMDSASEMRGCVPHLVETLKAITEFTNAGQETLKTLGKQVKSIDNVSSFSSRIKNNWPAIIACVSGISISKNMTELLTHVVPLLSLLGLDINFTNYFSEFFSKRASTQSGFANTKKLMIFLASFLGKYSPLTFVNKFTANMSSVTKEMESIDKLIEMMGDVLSEFGLDISSKAKAISELRSDMKELIEKTPEFEALVATKCVVFVREDKFKDFMFYYKKIQSIKCQVDTGVYSSIRNSNFCADLMNFNTRYIRMKNTIDQVRATNGRRQEPVAVLFHGAPKLGKSQLMCYIQKRICNVYQEFYADKEEYDFMDDFDEWTTWDQNTTDDYHQGYNGQEIHRIDDLFSRVDELDHKDILNFVSCVVFPTRQAELSEKGKPYTAKLIVASSNIWPRSSKEIKCIDALHRRFNIIKFVLKQGKTVPSQGFDTSFDWLDLYQISGSKYKGDNEASGKSTTLDLICRDIIENMKIKHDIFQAGLAAQQEEVPLAILPSLVKKPIPETHTKILMGSSWNCSVRLYKSHRHVYRFLKHLKSIDPISKREHYITELQTHNNSFNDTKCVLFSLAQYELAESRNYAIVCKEFDGSYTYYDAKTKSIHRTKEIIDEFLPEDIEEPVELDPPGFLDKLQLEFIKLYDRIYPTFRPIIKTLSGLGKCVFVFTNPQFSIIMSMISILLTHISSHVPETVFRIWEVMNDLTNIMYLIPAVIGIGTLIYYKCKTYVMKEPCKNCLFYIENLDEIRRMFCRDACRFFVEGGHANECGQSDTYISFILSDLCVACNNKSCLGDCSHSLPEDELDPYTLRLFRHWLSKNVHIQKPCSLPDEDETILADKIVLSPLGRPRVLEESPSQTKQVKQRRNLFEESPSNTKQAKIKRNILEESPNGNKQKAVKRSFFFESHNDNTTWREPYKTPQQKRKEEIRSFIEELSQPEELVEEYDFGGHNPGSKKIEKLNVQIVAEGVEQQACDRSARDLYSALVKSCYRCTRINSSGVSAFLYGHAFGKYVVTPSHLHMSSDSGAKYYIEAPENGVIKRMNLTLVAKKDNRDVALWQLESKSVFPQRFYDNLITDDEFIKFANQEIYVLQHLPKLDLTQLVTASTVEHKKIHLSGKGIQEYEKLLEVHATMTHSPVTSEGDCGGILVAFNNLIRKKIIGFHIIGAMDKAFSAIITRELIDSMIPIEAKEEALTYEVIDQQCSKFPLVDILNQITHVSDKPTNLPPGDFEYIGELDYMARPAANTGIKKHPLFGTFDVTCAPANLNTSEVANKDALLKDCHGNPNLLITRTEKYGKHFKNKIDPEILQDMEVQLTEYYKTMFLDKNLGISSDYEILNGDPTDTDSHHLDMRTSSGIYWSGTQNGHSHKKGYYTIDRINERGEIYKEFDYEKPHVKELMEIIKVTEDLAIKGYRTVSINKDCFKDELRPLEKVHKPRIFKNVPFDKVILLKKYAGKFKTEWTKMRGEMFHSVGINTTSPEWATLYHEMCNKSDKGCDADFGTYDGNLRPEFMDIAFRVIRSTIFQSTKSEETDKILEVLFDEIVRSLSVSCYTVYMDTHGNPSGSPFTTITNCIVNLLYHWYCFIRITGYKGFNKFTDTVCFRAFGDDVIYTAHPDIGYVFGNIQKIMIDELEQDYTDATKSIEGAVKPIEELSFLKRKFRIISPSIILSPIETNSIEMRFNYTNIPMTDYVTHKELIHEGLLEACMHGERYFKEFKNKMSHGIRSSSLNRKMKGFNPMFSDYYQDLLKRYQ